MKKNVKSLFLFTLCVLVLLSTSCARTEQKNAAPPSPQMFSPKPEFPPQITDNDMDQIRKDNHPPTKNSNPPPVVINPPTPLPNTDLGITPDVPRYSIVPKFNIVRVRLFPLFKRDTPYKDPFVANFHQNAISLKNSSGLALMDLESGNKITSSTTIKFDFSSDSIIVDNKKISNIKKVEILPLVASEGSTLLGLKESANNSDGTFKFAGSFVLSQTQVTNDEKKSIATWVLTNQVYLEDYVLSVTSSEIPHDWADHGNGGAEAVKAQSVAARSYGLNVIASVRKNIKRDWDVVPTTANQAYFGIKSINKKAKPLIESTAGQIIVNDNKVILAAFSANSGGYTCSAQDCWNMNVPYLAAREDIQEVRNLPGGEKRIELSKSILQSALNKIITLEAKTKVIDGLTIMRTNESKRVQQIAVKIGNKSQILNEAQTTTLLFKSGFKLGRLLEVGNITDKSIELIYSGFGHAVGMSQWGAFALSRRGSNYLEILSFYYLGTNIISLTK